MHSEFGVGMKNAEKLRLNRGGWQVCLTHELYKQVK